MMRTRVGRWRCLAVAVVAAAALLRPEQGAAAQVTAQIVEPSQNVATWGFTPNPLTVHVGDTVTWTNTGSAPHTVTGAPLNSVVLNPGARYTFITSAAGTIGYACSIHPSMRGTLVIQAPPQPTATSTPPPAATPLPVSTATPLPGTPTTVPATPTRVAITPGAGPAVPHDERYFVQTGFRIDNDVVWDYFNRRGGIQTFGYPVSRTFLFRGVLVQFFQRRIVEVGPNRAARQANLLDPELMPYTTINGANFPPPDPGVTGVAPSPNDAPATLAFVQRLAADQFGGRAVNFYRSFSDTVGLQVAFPNRGDPSLLPGIDLEMWGVPTSNPAFDPNNHNFVYQRWQRGIMHYDSGCACTQTILLADYLKAIITGQNLPVDLEQQAQGSVYLRQYDPTKPSWVRDPGRLPNTDFTNAFATG